MNVRKAIFPVGGLGTRFLPATKALPKEMLPIVDKPLIQYAVEEAIDAGFTELIFITGASKRAIKEHFNFNPDLSISNLTKDKKNFFMGKSVYSAVNNINTIIAKKNCWLRCK